MQERHPSKDGLLLYAKVGHISHPTLPVPTLYVPGLHFSQNKEADFAEYVPGLQNIHSLPADESWKRPAVQSRQRAEAFEL